MAFTNPSTNSYRRLIPGFEAPVSAVFSVGNRSAAIRIPAYANRPDNARFEFRPPDATCNPYLALAAQLLGPRPAVPATAETAAYDAARAVLAESRQRPGVVLSLACAPDVAAALSGPAAPTWQALAGRLGRAVDIEIDATMLAGTFSVREGT